MRQETNTEIDLLLRRMSRQDAGSVRESTEQHLGQHLDGDELSSYAQNALPAAARARYTEHLADCSTCRKLVTELSLSLGTTVAAAAQVETVAEPSALKKFFASLFTPMVMRYAVPALGLIVVAAIGFVILRDRSQSGFVAQLDTKQNQAAPITATPETPAPASSPNMALDDSAQKPQTGQAAPPVTNPKETAPPGGVLSAEPAAVGPAPAPAPTPASERAEAAAPASQPSVAAAEPPSAKTGYLADAEEKRKNEEKKKTEDQKKTDAVAKKESAPATVQTTDTSVASAKANEPARDENRAPKPADQRVDESKREALPVQRRTGTLGVGNVARARKQAEKDDDETRTVMGRRFRKERGIWTDTAYDSSTRTVDMARGSEQFRALVADEPEIKKIAEQLDGEVIVVWKGRAYRIR